MDLDRTPSVLIRALRGTQRCATIVLLLFSGETVSFFTDACAQAETKLTHVWDIPHTRQGFGFIISQSGDLALLGGYYAVQGTGSYMFSVYRNEGSTWARVADVGWEDYPAGTMGGDIDGDAIIVSNAWAYGSERGSVKIFRRGNDGWTTEAVIVGKVYGVDFSTHVSIDGDVFAATSDGCSGCGPFETSVFRHDGSNWVLDARLKPWDEEDVVSHQNPSAGVAVSGDAIIVGTTRECTSFENFTCGAYVYRHDGAAWNPEVKLTPQPRPPLDYTVWAVDLDGDVAAVALGTEDIGSLNSTSAGEVHVYRYDGTTWVHEAVLTPTEPSPPNDFFGWRSLSLTGNRIVVGDWGDQFLGGSAYVFQHDGSNWAPEFKLTAPDTDWNDNFGHTVSISGDIVLVGQPSDDENGVGSGAVYSYDLSARGAAKSVELVSPTNFDRQLPSEAELLWNPFPGAVSYDVKVFRDLYDQDGIWEGWTDVVEETGYLDTSLPLLGLAAGTVYYWMVRADTLGAPTRWSSVSRFETLRPLPTQPILAGPEDNAQGIDVVVWLRWSQSEWAESYWVQMAKDPQFQTLVIDTSGVITSDVDPTFLYLGNVLELDYLTEYHWRVRAENITGLGPWSESRRFTTRTDALAAPQLRSPPSGSENLPLRVHLKYGFVPGATTYEVQVSTSSTFDPLLVDSTGVADTLLVTPRLAPRKAHFWRVRAESPNVVSEWSTTNFFTTDYNSAPVFVSDPPLAGTVGTEFDYLAEVADADRDSILFDAIIVPAWLSLTDNNDATARLSGTPGAEHVGKHDVVVKASDPDSISLQSFAVTVTSNVATEDRGLPDDFALHQNFPNPFNPVTTIRYELPVRTAVKLTVFDVLGRVVTQITEDKPPGYHSLRLDASSYPSGIYFYSLEADAFSATRSLVLLK